MGKYFIFEDEKEIKETIESRLLSNDYGNYKFKEFDKNTEDIILICETCGAIIKTDLKGIEDGLISKECVNCIEIEKTEKIALQKEIAKIINDFHLELISIDENEFYIKCKMCGKEYHLNKDFYADMDPEMFCCKNWDCITTVLKEQKHWFALELENGKLKIVEKTCQYIPDKFAKYYEDWFDDFCDENDWIFKQKCEKCGTEKIFTLNQYVKQDVYCGCDFEKYEEYKTKHISKWDSANDTVHIQCLKCGNNFCLTEEKAWDECLDCPECLKIEKSIMNIKLEEYGFSERTLNSLKEAKIYTVKDILKLNATGLLNIYNLGLRGIIEILTKLDSNNLRISDCCKNNYPTIDDYLNKFINVCEQENAFQMTIDDLRINNRIKNNLVKSGISTPLELLTKTRAELLSTKLFGEKGIEIITNALMEQNVHLLNDEFYTCDKCGKQFVAEKSAEEKHYCRICTAKIERTSQICQIR